MTSCFGVRGRFVLPVIVAGLIAVGIGPASAQEGEDEKPYIVEDGKVDFGVYNGYRRYHSHCHTCHGPDGLGSSFGPALIESIETMSYGDFLEVVVNGRENVSQAQQNVMPAFGYVDDVMLYVDHIWAYLKARAEGDVGRGRPERLPRDEDPVWAEYQERKG